MADEGFLRRWARRKTESRVAEGTPPEEGRHARAHLSTPQPAPAPQPGAANPPAQGTADPDGPARTLPSMEDVARLTPDADFSAFVARGVDPAVRRGALKKLFADPHFNAMDGLDIYIDDYTKPSPVSAAMLASLTHAKRVLAPLLDEEKPAQPDPAPVQATGPAAEPHAEPSIAPAPAAASPAPEHTTTSEQPPQHTQETQETQ